MKLLKEFADCFSFRVSNNAIWIIKPNTYLKFVNEVEVHRLDRKPNIHLLQFISDDKFILIEDSKCFIEDMEGTLLLKSNGHIEKFKDDIVLIRERLTKKLIFFSLKQNNEIFSIDLLDSLVSPIFYHSENQFFGLSKANTCYLFDLDNKIIKWTFSTEILIKENDPFEEYDYYIKRFLGVIDNKLWIIIGKHNLLAIDIETGHLVHNLLYPYNDPYFENKFKGKNHFNSYFLIANSEQLVSLNANYFFTVIEDKSSGVAKIESEDISSELEKNELDPIGAPIRLEYIDDYILIATCGGSHTQPNNIGLFNYKTRKIVDVFSLDVKSDPQSERFPYIHPGITYIEILDGKAYILYGIYFHIGDKKVAVLDLEIEKLKMRGV